MPVLSIVVAIVSDTNGKPNAAHLGPCLEALKRQTGSQTTEIIVPYHPSTEGIEPLRRQYPQVRFLEVNDLRTWTGRPGNREHHDELRARGLGAARGDIIGLTEDHGQPMPEWSAKAMEGHRAPVAALGGAIENGVDRPLNWAVYFCDFFKYQTPLPEGESRLVSDANATYKRTALESIRPVWQDVFRETAVNGALRARGEKLALSPWLVVHQNRLGLTLVSAVKERYVWGRSYAATRAGDVGTGKRLFRAIFSPALPFLILARMVVTVLKRRRTVAPFFTALPITALLVATWCCGECAGYATGRTHG